MLLVRWSLLDGSDPWISIFPEGVGFQPGGDIEIQGLRDKRPELNRLYPINSIRQGLPSVQDMGGDLLPQQV